MCVSGFIYIYVRKYSYARHINTPPFPRRTYTNACQKTISIEGDYLTMLMFLSLVIHAFLLFSKSFHCQSKVIKEEPQLSLKILTLASIWQLVQMYRPNLFDFCSHLNLNRHSAEAETTSSRCLGNCMSSLISEAFSDCMTTLINKREATIPSSTESLIFHIA